MQKKKTCFESPAKSSCTFRHNPNCLSAGVLAEGEWCCRPGRQSSKGSKIGAKMNNTNEKINKNFIFYSFYSKIIL
jgi:hypothetical protein